MPGEVPEQSPPAPLGCSSPQPGSRSPPAPLLRCSPSILVPVYLLLMKGAELTSSMARLPVAKHRKGFNSLPLLEEGYSLPWGRGWCSRLPPWRSGDRAGYAGAEQLFADVDSRFPSNSRINIPAKVNLKTKSSCKWFPQQVETCC